MASYAQDCPDLGPEIRIFIYGSNKHKLIRMGWTHLVELLYSSYKFLVPDYFGSLSLCGRYRARAVALTCTILSHSVAGGQRLIWCYIKCQKGTKIVKLVMAS